MSGAAQQDMLEQLDFPVTGTESSAGLKEAVSERLEAHRRRRVASGTAVRREAAPAETAARRTRAGAAGASRVRDAVAARYQNSLTYREFLEQEAERALAQAQAEAEIAARNAQAVAEAQMQLLEELQRWDQPEVIESAPMEGMPVGMSQIEAAAATRVTHAGAPADVFSTGLTVRLYEDFNVVRSPVKGERQVSAQREEDGQETKDLDEEIAFRRAPEFERPHPEPVGIAGNLIQFPRQLVAARKVRPRLAEGPLREESAPEPQLRIFEVEPEQVSTAPAEPSSAPEWQSILLEGAARPEPVAPAGAQMHYAIPPQTASLQLRMMAAAVDGCCIGAGMLGFAVVAAIFGGAGLHALPLSLLGAIVAGVGCVLFVMFQMLFFTLGEATPGMRYARIALCTFGDDNPTRSAMRRRVLAILLAACPLGVGIAWAWMDDDGLGWHDRISRMYQRAY